MASVLAGPTYAIDGPIPQAPAHSLLTIPGALLPENPDPHPLVGVEMWPYPPDLPDTVAPCAEGTFAVKGDGDGWNLPIFGPFTAYLPISCSSISAARPGFAERAITAFKAREQFAVAYELAHGHAQPDNPFLADGNVHILNGGTAVTPDVGLALLEDAIGATGQAGLIHATNAVASAWNGSSGGYGVEDYGGTLYTTANRTPVAVSGGYIGATPRFGTAAGAGQAWVYATGPVQIRREPDVFLNAPSLKESMDRENNLVTYRAERIYVVSFDAPASSSDTAPLQAAVKVDWIP